MTRSHSATRDRLAALQPAVAPSMLKCDFADLAGEVAALEAAGARVLHLDVMDGHFVRNLTYGAPVIASLRKRTDAFLDAHLMISDPERYLDDFLKAGCDAITVHVEAVPQPVPLLRRIREAGVVAGLALNPAMPVEVVEPFLPECDQVLVMSVEPGFGGQSFQPGALDKLAALRNRGDSETILAVDGGIDMETIGPAAAAGATLFVVGSAVFGADDYGTAIGRLTEAATRSAPVPSGERTRE